MHFLRRLKVTGNYGKSALFHQESGGNKIDVSAEKEVHKTAQSCINHGENKTISAEKGQTMKKRIFLHIGYIILCSIITFIPVLSVHAETPPQTKTNADSPSVANNLIDLQIETSRNQPTAGPGLGIVAEIKNISNSTIYLRSKHITLILPPELDKQFTGINEWFAFFPTQSEEDQSNNRFAVYDRSILIKPGDTYSVFWTTSLSTRFQESNVLSLVNNINSIILAELNYLFFTPGEYKISVVAKYWTDPKFPLDNYRLTTQSKKVNVSTPQSVIIIGSAIGGLIAYFILPIARRRFIKSAIIKPEDIESATFKKLGRAIIETPFGKEIVGILGTILLSVIITILLARISETQFLIRITINDFWGAVAIGFVGNYTGFSFFGKYLSDETEIKEDTEQNSKLNNSKDPQKDKENS